MIAVTTPNPNLLALIGTTGVLTTDIIRKCLKIQIEMALCVILIITIEIYIFRVLIKKIIMEMAVINTKKFIDIMDGNIL